MNLPTDKPLSHACIIMASGSGTRFGGNKLMANLAGMPLVEHVLQATEGRFAERVVVTRHADVAQLARKAGARAVVHDLPLRNEAVALGMDALTCCDTVTFFQGDQPLVAGCTIDALLAAAERDPGCIWRASFRGQPGAPVLFLTWAFDALRHLPPGKGGGYVAKTHPERVRTVEAASPWELFDIDTTDDLRKLQVHIAG